MKTLANHQIIYDNECPLCNIYTSAFIKQKLLESNGRITFNEYAEENKYNIDIEKSKNQIALINTQTGETAYGLDSMLKILEHRFPFIKKIFSIKIIYWLFTKLYSFISYNRKIIAPSKTVSNTCKPSFNIKYRLVFICFCALVSFIIVKNYLGLLQIENNIQIAFIFIASQIIILCLLSIKSTVEKSVNILGHLQFVNLLGGMLLTPIFLLQNIVSIEMIKIYGLIIIAFFLVLFCRRLKCV